VGGKRGKGDLKQLTRKPCSSAGIKIPRKRRRGIDLSYGGGKRREESHPREVEEGVVVHSPQEEGLKGKRCKRRARVRPTVVRGRKP